MIFLGLPVSVFLVKRGLMLILTRINADVKNKNLSFIISYLPLVILMPFLWTFFDFLQAKYGFLPTYIITAGNIFGSSPFLGLAGFGGLITLAFFAALINVLIALLILNFKNSGFKLSIRNLRQPPYLILILLIVFVIGGGYLISKSELKKNAFAYQNSPAKIKIALVSNNGDFDKEFEAFESDILSSEEKAKAEAIIEKILGPIKNELYGEKIDLTVLPEDMIDIESWQDPDTEAKNKFGIENAGILIEAYRKLAQEINTNLAVTLTTIQNNKRYNSTVLFDRDGEIVDIYNKFNLAILGEYWPFGNWRPFYFNLIKNLAPGKIGQGGAVFNGKYTYSPGQKKILQTEGLIFGSAICSEIQYPSQIEEFKKMGAKFISHTATNRWAVIGLNSFRELTDNLRKIEAVWLGMPILINGREEMAGIITPDGKMDSVNFESQNKDFGIFIGEIKLK